MSKIALISAFTAILVFGGCSSKEPVTEPTKIFNENTPEKSDSKNMNSKFDHTVIEKKDVPALLTKRPG